MSRSTTPRVRLRLRSAALLSAVLAAVVALGAWKVSALHSADAASANQPEPTETVAAAIASARPHQETATAIGTVIAPRSITLRNEVPGTVRYAALRPGQIVEA